jgi:hypothetical protein
MEGTGRKREYVHSDLTLAMGDTATCSLAQPGISSDPSETTTSKEEGPTYRILEFLT